MASSSQYRFDRRSKREFEKQISERTLVERQLFIRWLDWYSKQNGYTPTYRETGCAPHGELIEDREVSTQADFYVDGFGLVEIKFAYPTLERYFHLKVNQTKSYIRQGATILMVIGVETDNVQFTMLRPETLQEIVDECRVVRWTGFSGKKSFRVDVKDFIWRDLP